MIYDIGIIGGGASGMWAAITAAQLGKKVCIIEHSDRLGRKILSTGNGKCNITNLDMQPEYYHSDTGSDYYDIVAGYPPEAVIDFFRELGMYTKIKHGYVYPASEQAQTVLDVLKEETTRLGVDLFTESRPVKITPGFTVQCEHRTVSCRRLILACGGAAAPKTGSDGSGYKLAQALGHSIQKPIPALTAIRCKGNFFKEVHGVRCDCLLTVWTNESEVVAEQGELQLTDYGISGIPVFQISRIVKRLLDTGKQPVVTLNFFPGIPVKTLRERLLHATTRDLSRDVLSALSGFCNRKLASVLCKESAISPQTACGNLAGKDYDRLLDHMVHFKVVPLDTNGFDQAQVSAGGVSMAEINEHTMESLLIKDLFFAGEIVDVDGICGGYNLHWAFASGHAAAVHASGE